MGGEMTTRHEDPSFSRNKPPVAGAHRLAELADRKSAPNTSSVPREHWVDEDHPEDWRLSAAGQPS